MTSRSVEVGKVWWSGPIPTCPRCLAGVHSEHDGWLCLWCGYSEIIDAEDLPQLVCRERSAAGPVGRTTS
jgi:ribosomal protein S27AE